MFVVIEGIDGSGKGTQSKLLADYYNSKGIKAEIISFPAYDVTDSAKMIAKYLNGGYGELNSVSPAFASTLYALDRYELRSKIIDNINSNDILIADRYTTSNFAHQASKFEGSKQSEFITFLKDFEYNKLGLPIPDKIIFLDVSIDKTKDMILSKGQRSYTNDKKDIHEKDLTYQEKVSKAYRDIAKNEEWDIISCEDSSGNLRSKEDILSEIIKLINL